VEIALLALRLVVGLGFAAHGAQKLFGAFGGHGIDGTAGFFEQIGLRPGRLRARAAGTVELVGGLLIALGLVTPFAAAALIAVMTAAVLTVHVRKGFFNTAGGYEYNLVLAAALFALAGIGAGDWSLDKVLGLALAGSGWALGALGAGAVGGLAAVSAGACWPSARRAAASRTPPEWPGRPWRQAKTAPRSAAARQPLPITSAARRSISSGGTSSM
jgi:putative oxidoreductase